MSVVPFPLSPAGDAFRYWAKAALRESLSEQFAPERIDVLIDGLDQHAEWKKLEVDLYHAFNHEPDAQAALALVTELMIEWICRVSAALNESRSVKSSVYAS